MFFFKRRCEPLPTNVQAYVDAPRPDEQMQWREASYSVIDIETSGLNHKKDSLLAIGMIDIEKGRIRLDRRWYTLVRPPDETLVGAESICIHGLLRTDLADAPLAKDVLLELAERIKERVLVVHVSSIDVKFLDRALKNHFGIRLHGPVLDTARLAGKMLHQESMVGGGAGYYEGPRDISLRSLSRQANLPIHSQHNALSDALSTAQLFLSQVTRFEKEGIDTLGKLMRAGGSLK